MPRGVEGGAMFMLGIDRAIKVMSSEILLSFQASQKGGK